MRIASDLKVQAYILMDGDIREDVFALVFLERIKGRDGDRWRISNRGDVLSKIPDKNGRFCFHSATPPSSRDEDYYKQYRFGTADEAVEFWDKNRNLIPATQQERRDYYQVIGAYKWAGRRES